MQGGYVAGGPTAEHDGRRAQLEGRQINAEGVRVVGLGMQTKASAHRRDRHLPADYQPLAANDDLDSRPERHAGLGVREHPGPNE